MISIAASSGIEIINPMAGGHPEHSSVAIRNNRIALTTGPGIRVAHGAMPPPPATALGGCLIIENTVQQCGAGIRIETMSGCKINNNVLWHNTGDGIQWSGGGNGMVLDNVASDNSGSGILISAEGVQVANNVMSGNAVCGLYLLGSNITYGRNSATGNGASGSCPTTCGLSAPTRCWPSTPPPGVGNVTPDFCDLGLGNKSFCNNLMPGPPPL